MKGLPTVFWMDIPRPTLHERINARVTAMLQHGWIDETAALKKCFGARAASIPAGDNAAHLLPAAVV